MSTYSYRDLVIRYMAGLNRLDDRYSEIRPVTPAGGAGFFSIVFHARDEQLGIPVILKVFDPRHDANHRRKEYFRREAEALRDMGEHRNIRHLAEVLCGCTRHQAALPVSDDAAVEHALEYYSMRPYARTLEQYIYTDERSLADLLITFREVVAGVHCAHRFEYCHRDLKPDNVLMRDDGYVAVSDFGSAKRLATLASRDLEDYEPTPAGHYHYTSPELLAGLTTVEHFYSTDVFALGLILFEMLNRTKFAFRSVGYIAMVTHLPQIPTHERTLEGRARELRTILSAVTATAPLVPVLSTPDGPPEFRRHLEELFARLTDFDYERRVRSFDYIFTKIDRCLRAIGTTGVKREYRTN